MTAALQKKSRTVAVTRRPRILHFLTAPRAEGTPRLVLDWLDRTDVAEQSVAFLFSTPDELRSEFERREAGVAFRESTRRGWKQMASIVRFSRKVVRDFQPDLVVCWPMGLATWVAMGARVAKFRGTFATHAGNPPDDRWFGRVQSWLTFFALRIFDGHVAACSRYIKDEYMRVPFCPGHRVAIAYNAIDTDRFRMTGRRGGRTANIPTVVMVGTLEHHKDHPTLIRAASWLKSRGKPIRIRLVGQGSRFNEYSELIAALAVGDCCELLGARNDVPDLLRDADLFVLSTTAREGRPGVLLEALASGLPVIASDVAPCREVLAGGRWGDLVSPNNPAALGEAIQRRLRATAQDFWQDQVDYACSFTVPTMMQQYLSLGAGRET